MLKKIFNRIKAITLSEILLLIIALLAVASYNEALQIQTHIKKIKSDISSIKSDVSEIHSSTSSIESDVSTIDLAVQFFMAK